MTETATEQEWLVDHCVCGHHITAHAKGKDACRYHPGVCAAYRWDEVGIRRLTARPADGVDPAEIVRQRALGWPDFHPETYCHRCGRPNVSSWWVDSPQWNAAVEGENRGVVSILCPPCFTGLWEQVTGESVSWELRIDPRSRAAREGRVPGSARPVCGQPIHTTDEEADRG